MAATVKPVMQGKATETSAAEKTTGLKFERFFTEGPAGKPHFDLEGYIVSRLAAAGIRKVEASGLDTYADPGRFYSYRRATHRGEPDYGRQIALVGVPGPL